MTQQFPRQKRKSERITAEFNMPGRQDSTADDKNAPTPAIHVIGYSPDDWAEKDITTTGDMISFFASWPVVWLNIDPMCEGPQAQRVVEKFAGIFNLHELAVEDVVNVHQRAKVEEYDEHMFVVIRMLIEKDAAETEQLSMFLGKNYVITFREVPKDCLDPVREKIRKSRGRIRTEGPDYLMYSIIDAVVDSYFPLATALAQRVDKIEEETLSNKNAVMTPEQMYEIRRDLLSIRRSVWPVREALTSLTREGCPFISDSTRVYLRDCYDHAVRIIDFLEMHRDIASALMELHDTRSNNRLNEVMKVLTIITVLLLPPTVIAGIYGMNFPIPEANWFGHWGYPFALSLMALVSFGLYSWLRYRGWLGDHHHRI